MLGNIKDASGAVIPGVTVTATNTGTNQTREAIANESGMFTFTNLQAGTYTLKIGMQGFKEYVKTEILSDREQHHAAGCDA